MALKRLLQMSSVTRNWTVLSNYIAPSQKISQMYSTNPTDITQFEDYESIKEKNYMLSDVKTEEHHMKILETTAVNYTNMSLPSAMETISALYKASRNVRNVENIKKHVGFLRLCEVLNRDIRFMKIHEVLENLKIFTYFKISTNSLLVQSFLQIIRTNINELSLRNIIFITTLLSRMDSTPLRDALLIALPVVFEAQFSTKYDSNDINLSKLSLRYTNMYNIQNTQIQDIILTTIWTHKDDLDIQTAKSIFYSLCHTSLLPPIAFEILFNIQKVLTVKAKELSAQEATLTVSKIVSTIINNKEHGYKFYDEALVDALINSALFSNVSFFDGIYLLKMLNNLNHVHIPYLEYLAAKCFEEPNLLKSTPYHQIYHFIQGFVNADYKPIFWDTIRDALLASEIETRCLDRSLIKLVLHLIALDCYSPNLLGKAFLQDVKSNEKMKNIHATEMLMLYQSVKTLYPMYSGPWPPQDILEYAATLKLKSPTFSLKAALERALGGPQYVYNNLRTKLGHYIDHIVVMRKGGYPVAINTFAQVSDTIYIEDIKTPSESQTILIFNLPDDAYAVNSQRLKSTWSLKIKSAEALTNSTTIAINSGLWVKLPEYERVPYLMQAIKLKCEDLSTTVN